MQLKGKAAFVTGGGSGIGREFCFQLSENGCRVTVADRDKQNASEVAREIASRGGEAQAAAVDVTKDEAVVAALQEHVDRYKSLDIVCLNAGVMEPGRAAVQPLLVATIYLASLANITHLNFAQIPDGPMAQHMKFFLGNLLAANNTGGWKRTLDINLKAQISGTILAARAMEESKSKGVILYTASAGGIFPMPAAPVYAASKAGLIHLAQSLSSRLAKRGIRVCTVCPQGVDTPLVRAMQGDASWTHNTEAMPTKYANTLLSAAQVAACGLSLINDDSKQGTIAFLHVTGRTYEYMPSKVPLRRLQLGRRQGTGERPQVDQAALLAWASKSKPSKQKRVQVFRLSSDFRAATRIVEEAIPAPQKGQVLVRRAFAGVNASDVNFTSGRYFGTPEQSAKQLPFYAGFEAVGVVAAVGEGVKGLKVGDCVAELSFGTFSEWGILSEKLALPVPACSPEIVALLTSGLTASIGLEVAGRMSTEETVLVTAAAGGTGQFVVQLAKAAGNHVIATCGSRAKADYLKRLGADRVINYKNEDLKAVLKKEYPKGVNLVWESVGGEMFRTCAKALASGGRLIVIGMMSQYGSGWKPSENKGLLEQLLQKSASVNGFFLPQHSRLYKQHLRTLAALWKQGDLQASIDPSKFSGIEAAADAVEHLQQGASIGKVILQLTREVPALSAISLTSRL